MNEERMQILEMLSAGTITTEQADRLLEALEPVIRGHDGGSRRAFSDRGRSATYPSSPAQERLARARERLSTASAHGVDPAFIEDLKEADLGNLSLDDLIRLRDHGVDGNFVREMRAAGFTDVPADKLIELRDHGVDGEYVRAMRELALDEELEAEL